MQDPAQRLERLTKAIAAQVETWSRRPLVAALLCLRGFALLNAATWVAEIGNFTRFTHPSQLMSYIGITPSEDSSGPRRRQGTITKTGNEAGRRAIIEAAWPYRLSARVTPHLRRRQHGQPKAVIEIAWKAQTRLCERYQALIRHRKKTVVVVTAIARATGRGGGSFEEKDPRNFKERSAAAREAREAGEAGAQGRAPLHAGRPQEIQGHPAGGWETGCASRGQENFEKREEGHGGALKRPRRKSSGTSERSLTTRP